MLSMVWSDGALVVEAGLHLKAAHRHHAVQLSLALEPPCWAAFDGSPHELPCRAVLIAPNRLHTLRGSVVSLLLEPHSVYGHALWRALGAPGFVTLTHPALDAFLTAVVREGLASLHGGQGLERCREAASELLHELARSLPPRHDLRLDDRVAEVRAQLLRSGGLRLSLSELAENARLSPDRLRHLFADQMGLPIRSYVLWLRTIAGLSALVRGDSVGQVAHRVGFADQAAFARAYRNAWGISPSTFGRVVRVASPQLASDAVRQGSWLGAATTA